MQRHMVKWLMLAFFLIIPLTGYAQPASGSLPTFEPNLRVGILTNQQSIQVSADAKFDMISTETSKVLRSFQAYDEVTITVSDDGFSINGVPVMSAGINVVQKKDEMMVYIEPRIYINKRRYRGDISIHHTVDKSGMTVVNTLPLEQYLYGVIKNEISPEWPMEAVKAQAVAARTYALTNYNKHKADGFDLCSTTDCQVYGGQESEAPRALAAVDATSGLVITYNDKLITAYFHSSSGGYTENSENVWSSAQPYLRAVADFDQNCPYFKWEKQLTIAELNQLITKAGYTIGNLQAIELSPLATPPLISSDRGVSGRVKSIQMLGTNGSVQVSGTKLRSILELKSTLFDITMVGSGHKNFAMPVYAGNGKNIEQSKINYALTSKESYNLRPVSSEPNDLVVITGFGWGHGLGLSQWGAKAMAEKGPAGNTEYFKEILKHYYQGVEIKKAY